MSDPVRILFVEDVPADAELAIHEIRAALADCLFERVETEEDFLRQLDAFCPDLVLSDYHLPHFTGLRALEIVQSRAPLTPLIIITGSLSEDTAVACIRAGAANYVLKDHFKRLGTAVSHALEEKKVRMERREAEQALQESLNVFTGFLEQSTDAIMLTDEQGMIVQWSKGAERLTGYSREDSVGVPLWDVQFRSVPDALKSPQLYEGLKASLQAALLSGQSPFLDRFLETALQQQNGNQLTVQTSAFSIQTQKGFILGGILRDVTERKHAEEALRESEERFRGLYENNTLGLYRTTPDGHILLANPALVRMLGFRSFDELRERNLEQEGFEPSYSRSQFIQGMEQQGEIMGLESAWERRDGSTIFVRESARAIRDARGEICYFDGTVEDISERKRAAEALRDNENRFRALIENSADAITLLDAQGTVLYDSPSAPGLLGYGPLDWKGRNAMALIHPDDAPEMQGSLRGIVETPRARATGTFRLRHKSGSWLWIDAVATNLLDEPGVHAIVVNYRDITARKRAEALQDAVYRIASATMTTPSLDELYAEIHRIISGVMDAENFYITLYDAERDLLTFPYFKDASDEAYMADARPERGLTAYVLRTGKSLLCTQAVHDELEQRGEVKLLGTPSSIWLGVPLIIHGKAIGAMVVQHYSDPAAYTEREQNILEFVSAQVATAIESKQAGQALAEREARYRALFEDSPISLWEEDFSGVKQKLLALQADGVTNIEEYLTAHPEIVREFAAAVKVLDVNKATLALQGADRKEDLLQGIMMALEGVPLRDFRDELVRIAAGETSFHWNGLNRTLDGRLLNISMNWSTMPGYEDSLERVIVSMIDTTERKRAEQALRESEERFRKIYQGSPIGMATTGADFRFIQVNPSFCTMMGYSEQELASMTFKELTHPDHVTADVQNSTKLFRRELDVYRTEKRYIRKDGEVIWGSVTLSVRRDDDGHFLYYLVMVEDITERKRAEEARAESEQRYLSLFENMLDGFAYCRMIYDGDRPVDFIYLDVNDSFERLTGLKGVTGKMVSEVIPGIHESNPQLLATYARVALTGKPEAFEAYVENLKMWFSISVYSPKTEHFVAVFDVITARKRAEDENLALLEIMQAAVSTSSLDQFLESLRQSLNKVLYAENLFVVFHQKNTGLFEEVFEVDKYDPPMPPDMLKKSITAYVYRTGEPLLLTQERFSELAAQGEVELVGENSSSWLGAPLKTPTETIGVIAVQNYEDPDCYTERDRTFLASVAAQVALAIERKQAGEKSDGERILLRTLIDNLPDRIYVMDQDGRKILSNAADWQAAGVGAMEDVIGKTDLESYGPELAQGYWELDRQVISSGIPVFNHEEQGFDPDGNPVCVLTSKVPLRDAHGEVRGLVGIGHDITARKQAEARIEKHVHRLSALRAVDLAISSSFDLRLSLNILLSQALNELHVDAAAVLLLNPVTNELEFTTGAGFRGAGLAGLRLKLGAGYAGQAALERRIVNVPDVTAVTHKFAQPEMITEEGFVAFIAVPLVAKGQIKGVLELFHRARLYPDPEWQDFLETLAGQAAIAIDNTQLFTELQSSSMELTLAYDSTIEGWSRAMDLRDKETEGHTQRVTEAAVKLGQALGLPDAELVHLRRGALLHDMGKMGVPDAILLKPGPLTEDEWQLMRQHPTLAYQMLARVRYLQPALNVPYCHHEKWDGSGYPRGLKGEQIPLSARIFAVVDVYDALTSDRPYRPAWSLEKAQDYIRSECGKHFDARVAEVFLNMVGAKGTGAA